MKCTAIWIIDENYVLPAYLSICSFLSSNSIPIKVIYCGAANLERNRAYFENIDSLVQFENYKLPNSLHKYSNDPVIINRIARMQYAQGEPNETILLVDADIVFSKQSNSLLNEIENYLTSEASAILGVLDAKVAYRDYLYFKTQNENGQEIPVPHLTQKDIYQGVFGTNWWHHLKGASLNNGLLAFYNCTEVVEIWKDFYLKGLLYAEVNSGDDQLPLAGAIHRTKQNVISLDEKYNSKGKIDGNYIVYHALSSSWKMQLWAAIKGEEGVSDFSNRVKELLPKVPASLLSEFKSQNSKIDPYLYKKLEGKFGFKHLYEDIICGLDSGNVVEVGLKYGKSTCFMSEMIRNSSKHISFLAVKLQSDKEEKLVDFYDLTKSAELSSYYDLIDETQLSKFGLIRDKDFVFLNFENDYNQLYTALEFWYLRIRPGGILAGYDYTAQIGLSYGNQCATYEFCEKYGLSLRISFDIFIIEIPTEEIEAHQAYYLSHKMTEKV